VRVQGGTSGLIAAITAGRLDPLSGEVIDYHRPWPTRRKDWYDLARRNREDYRDQAKAERWHMGRVVLSTPDLADPSPF
jgi:hypothetical protein